MNCEPQEGFKVVIPKANEIFLDIDSKEALCLWNKQMDILEDNGIHTTCKVVQSKSKGDHYHVIVSFEFKLSDWQRIALQACLGSDPIKELLSCIRVMYEIEDPVLFFEPITETERQAVKDLTEIN